MIEKRAYGMYRKSSKPFSQARQDLIDALKERGFGILWEIDVKKTMKEKVGADMEPYVILGACNPPIAHQAFSAEPDVGLLLPCNCIVRSTQGGTILGAVEPHELLKLTGRGDIAPLADQVETALAQAIDEAAG
ncbi:MAG: DUF302 domain-containing protein [Acidobacteriota bacterium]|jgi:uncharacterized protein (DUF302 family)